MSFKTGLKIDWVEGTNNLILRESLRYYDKRSKQLFIIACGLVSDGASIPRFLWPILGHPFQHPMREAAILHDFLYYYNVVPRKIADQIFYDALVESGMNRYKAQIYYFGVRVGGRSAYKKHSKKG